MKILFIDDDQTYFDLISKHLRYLGIEFYPKYLEEFESFRNSVGCSFSARESVAKESLQKVIHKINEFKNGGDDIVFVFDYSLNDSDPDTINGISLCEKIFPSGFSDKVIIMSKTSDRNDLDRINNFVVNNLNCSFLSKNNKAFLQMLMEKIYTR